MKKIVQILIPALLIGLASPGFAAPKSSETQQVADNNPSLYESIKIELGPFLENIPAHLEKEHGFNDRSEFAKAVPASIYRIVGVDQNGNTFKTNLYNVVLSVNGEYRAVLTVSTTDGRYEIESIGGALLASELQAFETQNHLTSDKEAILVNVYTRSASFVGYQNKNEGIETTELVPLASAKSGLTGSSGIRALKSTYTIAEAVEALQLK